MIQCVVFDFDGTLVQSNSIKRQGFYEVTKALGDVAEVVDTVLVDKVGDRQAIFAELVRRLQTTGRLPAVRVEQTLAHDLVDRYTSYCEESIASCAEVVGATACLEALTALQVALFVSSATPTAPLRQVLRRRGIDRFFRQILGRPAGKVENLRLAMAEVMAAPEATVMVGDNEVDRTAAVAVGCHFVGIENDFSGYTQRPSILIDDLRQLPPIILSLNRDPDSATATTRIRK